MEERCRIPTMKESDGCIVDMYLLGGETCGWYLDIRVCRYTYFQNGFS